MKQDVPPVWFMPLAQHGEQDELAFYARTVVEPESLLATIPAVIRRLDPNLPVEDLKTLRQQVRENVSEDRLISTLSAAFAVLATLLAAIGLYGVLAYTVAQRTREIGLRMALGAGREQIRGMVLGKVTQMTLVGGTIGIVAALVAGRAVRSLLFGVEADDPVAMTTASLLLAIVALGAGLLPARRASRVDPMVAMRSE
ncbi:MAG: FtsX-like permease family protein [Thermoanaerobaculia bacterium]